MRTLIPVQTLYASFSDRDMADRAVAALLDSGASPRDVSMVARDDKPVGKRLSGVDDDAKVNDVGGGITTTTGADAAIGSVKGAGIGLGIGVLAAVSSIVVPGVGIVTGGGALAAAIAGTAGTTAAGAAAGGLAGYLKDQGIHEAAVSRYSEDVETGGAMLGVKVPSNGVDEQLAKRILAKYHGNYVCAFGGYGEE